MKIKYAKDLFAIAFVLIVGCELSAASFVQNADCAKGSTFWCEHIMNAKKCNAVDHCIQTVWEKHDVRIDTNVLCDDCKDWVEKARKIIADEGITNEVISSLELSCELCPSQNGKSKCKELIEENIHEIQKLLLSAMNPDAVCSAMHLCNNAAFTEMFANKRVEVPKQHMLPFTCGQCSVIGSYLEKKFKALNRDEVLEGTLKMCGETSSFSDSCMNVVLRNSDDIYLHLLKQITRSNLCQTTCANHNQYSEGIVGIEPAFSDSAIPCELCEQLMLHLREVLIANTTEIEFKNILEGFCAQIPKITDECISISNQYYDAIYHFLSNGLDANKTCSLIGICASKSYKVPPMPLLSADTFAEPSFLTSNNLKVEISEENTLQLVNGGKWCAACEYAMHFIHIEIGKNTAQDKIAEYARKSCLTLPKKFVKQCQEVMDMFGDEIAMAIYQGSDPRLVCSKTKLCPANLDVDYLEINAVSEKPTCPFCLFAMQEVLDVIQSNSTKDNVEKVVSQLCNHLNDKLKSQCVDFVKQYSAEVVDMVLAKFTPQEACVFIRLCSNDQPKLRFGKLAASSEIIIDDSDFIDDSSSSALVLNPQCELCKTIIKLVEERVINVKSKDEIRRELENSCSRLRKFAKECTKFVDKYSDRIVDLVSEELEPEQVCRELIFCVSENKRDDQDYDSGLDLLRMAFESEDEIEVDESASGELAPPGCVLCEFVIKTIEDDLNDKKTDEQIKNIVKNICTKMPSSIGKQCTQFVNYYFDMIIALIETSPPDQVCQRMNLCTKSLEQKLQDLQSDVYTCAVCRGVVESMDSIIEDPQIDDTIENFIQKSCTKFAGKFKDKCHNLASTYGLAIINLLKNMTESDQVCFKLNLCANNGARVTLVN